jgi:hypothetical protein
MLAVLFPYGLIQIVIILLVAGVLLWGISQLPIDATIQKIVRVIVIVVVAIYVIYYLASLLPR